MLPALLLPEIESILQFEALRLQKSGWINNNLRHSFFGFKTNLSALFIWFVIKNMLRHWNVCVCACCNDSFYKNFWFEITYWLLHSQPPNLLFPECHISCCTQTQSHTSRLRLRTCTYCRMQVVSRCVSYNNLFSTQCRFPIKFWAWIEIHILLHLVENER